VSKSADAAVRHAIAAFLHRIVRDEFGGNGTKAAQAIGIPQSQISAAMNPSESGRGAGLVTLIRIADYAGVALDEVIGRKVPPRGSAEQGPVSGPRDTGAEGDDGTHRIHHNFG
jgi:hypothetical protein